MGLFSNNKKLCPICGNPTPRVLPAKLEGMPICKECEHKSDLPDGMFNKMTVDEYKKYVDFYDANEALRSSFTESYRYDFGFFGGDLLLDTAHRLFRLKNDDNALVMDASNLKSFRILEDDKIIFDGNANRLKITKTNIRDRVAAMAPQLMQYTMQLREYERLEQMERMLDKDDDNRGRRYNPRPIFDFPNPVDKFYVELTFDHPYWDSFKKKIGGPAFDTDYPSTDIYLQDYDAAVSNLYTLAVNLMQIINPSAPEIGADSENKPQPSVAAQTTVDSVAEIKKYKELLDAGIITKEEFTAKKRLLMGI